MPKKVDSERMQEAIAEMMRSTPPKSPVKGDLVVRLSGNRVLVRLERKRARLMTPGHEEGG